MSASGTPETPALTFEVLGPLSVRREGQPVRLGSTKQRLILAMLLVNRGRVLSVDGIVEGLWGEDPPVRAASTLQVHVSNLRKALAPGTPSIVTQPPGYVVTATAANLDLLRFEGLVRTAAAQRDGGALDTAEATLTAALDLWRGPALADLVGEAPADAARAWLAERWIAAVADRLDARMGLGRHREVIAEVELLVAEHPTREDLWEHLAVALYRVGRQADALAAVQRCRRALVETLGIDPGPRLQTVERQILHHDPALDAPHPLTTATLAAPGPAVTNPAVSNPAARPEPTPSPTTPPQPVPRPESGLAVAPEPFVVPVAPAEALDGSAATVRVRRNAGSLVLADGTPVALHQPIRLGRHPDCDVVLVDPTVSRFHAEVRPALGGHLLVDLESANGTFVNREPATERLLADGDEIWLGSHSVRYVATAPTPDASTAQPATDPDRPGDLDGPPQR